MDVPGTAATVDLTGRSDARLVALVRAGEDEAFEELYRRYQRRVRRFIAGRVGDSARAEELTQEAFLSALRGVRASDSAIAWRPWLFEIARNATIDFHRRYGNSAELSVEHGQLMHLVDNSRLTASRAPDAELDAKERFTHLRGALDELPPNHHEVLVMRELEGRSYNEIAERLSLTHAAVESKLFRARRRLEREFDELSSGRRCVAVRAIIGLLSEGVDRRSERRRVARHVRRCSACRRHARELGVDPFERRGQPGMGALLPVGWLLRRVTDSSGGEGLVANGGSVLGAGAERLVALVAAGAIACAGFSTGRETVPRGAIATGPASAAAAVAPQASSGAAGTRVRGRTAFLSEARPARLWAGRPRAKARPSASPRAAATAPSEPSKPAAAPPPRAAAAPQAQTVTLQAQSPRDALAQVKEPAAGALGDVVDRAAPEPRQVVARLPLPEAVRLVPHE